MMDEVHRGVDLAGNGAERNRVAVEVVNISRTYDSTRALSGIDLKIMSGEVLGLVGQNGAGKSTLIKIISGAEVPDPGGEIRLWGRQLQSRHRHRSSREGVSVVPQDLGLVGRLTAFENLVAWRQYGTKSIGPIRWKQQRQLADERVARFGVPVDLDKRADDLDAVEAAAIAIVRGLWAADLSVGSPVLLLDEPTAYLPQEDVARLLEKIRTLVVDGAAVVYVSHRIDEVLKVCDRVTVLRDGKTVLTSTTDLISSADLVQAMVGRDIGELYPARADFREGDEPRCRVDLMSGKVVSGVSFQVGAGEIVGITGLVGMGQDEIPHLLAGLDEHRGDIRVAGVTLPPKVGPRKVLSSGLATVPANRHLSGLWVGGSAIENFSLPRLAGYWRRGLLRGKKERTDTLRTMESFDVRPLNPDLKIRSFSGGNQQKLIVAKWVACKPKVLVLAEPTQGIDVSAKKELWSLLGDEVADGLAVIICSADYLELSQVCHRVLVLRHGKMVKELRGSDISEQAIFEAASAT